MAVYLSARDNTHAFSTSLIQTMSLKSASWIMVHINILNQQRYLDLSESTLSSQSEEQRHTKQQTIF